jgi:hypothetical protein
LTPPDAHRTVNFVILSLSKDEGTPLQTLRRVSSLKPAEFRGFSGAVS